MSGTIHLFGEHDLPWIDEVIDVVEAAAGEPWRVALERLDLFQRLERPAEPYRFTSIVVALQRVLGGRMNNARFARRARELVLGHPALDADARAARIRGAARELEVTVERLEAMLWSDLPSERPVELRFGRPAELEVAAFANVTLIQRSLRRAHAAVLRVWGDAGALLRAARRCGLLVTASTGRDGEIELELVGPLALCHRTSVYGRALGSLVPLLAEYDRFELELHAHTRTGSYAATLASPVLLPTAPVHLVAPHQSIARLARDLARLDPELVVTPAPPALPSGDALSCPDLIVERGGRRYCVELVGFWTAAFLARKLDAYAAAGDAEVVLCLDDERAVGDEEPPEGVLRYQRRLTAAALLAALAEERGVRTATEPT